MAVFQKQVRASESPEDAVIGNVAPIVTPLGRERQRAAFDGKSRKRRHFRALLFDHTCRGVRSCSRTSSSRDANEKLRRFT